MVKDFMLKCTRVSFNFRYNKLMTQVISSDALARAPKVVKRVVGRKIWTMTDLQGRKPRRFLILLDMETQLKMMYSHTLQYIPSN
jgi:hypothetical protein